jgi:hypothetical protein
MTGIFHSTNITRQPSIKQLSDYDKDIVTAVRFSDLNSLKRLYAEGRWLVFSY